mgnify:CR=1 FL=1
MISATRMLCQKYTDLTDAEISYLESYGALLPALANAEQADVFIDCRTVSGRSAIVVCEAKPQTVPSNYRSSILGMLIHWRDEPAVDRSFRLAVPTSGVRAVSMPEDRRIVQSVEPLFYEGRLIGVLIYERPALAAEEPPPAGEREAEQASGALDWAAVSPCLDDAVLFLDEEDRVCGFNPAATALYRRMGYIGTLAGMPVNNIQPAALSECDQDRHETALANRVLQYQRLPLSSGQARAALIIHDLTRQRQLEEELALQRTALQELRHRMKNNLQMLANLTRSRGCDPAESPPVQTALLDTANRLLSLAATLDGIVQGSREKVSLLQILVHAPDPSALRPPCHHPRGRRGRHCVRGLRLLGGPGGQRAGAERPEIRLSLRPGGKDRHRAPQRAPPLPAHRLGQRRGLPGGPPSPRRRRSGAGLHDRAGEAHRRVERGERPRRDADLLRLSGAVKPNRAPT